MNNTINTKFFYKNLIGLFKYFKVKILKLKNNYINHVKSVTRWSFVYGFNQSRLSKELWQH